MEHTPKQTSFRVGADNSASPAKAINIPAISLPKGGGALRSIDEKFAVNAANGTASYSLPLPFSQSRSSFGPSVTLSYNSGGGNAVFGLGWSADPGAIQRRTEKKLPVYDNDTDTFQLAGAEDLVPLLDQSGPDWKPAGSTNDLVRQYRPRIEGTFARIERVQLPDTTVYFWKVTSRDNITTIYGWSAAARIADPDDPARIVSWLPEWSYDNRGNCFCYDYKAEDGTNVPPLISERNRQNGLQRTANRYLKRIRHGNRTPYFPDAAQPYQPVPPVTDFFFEVVFDYGEHDWLNPEPLVEPTLWPCRFDPFSEGRAGFDRRTYRLCRRILFFHQFKELSPLDVAIPCLVRSLDLTYRHFHFNDAPYVPQEAELLTSITQTHYERMPDGTYERAVLPPVKFMYNQLHWSNMVQTVSRDDAPNLPVGLTNGYQWTDLYGEGIAGVLTEAASGWYYVANRGNGQFERARQVAPRPSLSGLTTGALQLQDLGADGKKQVVSLSGDLKGYFEQTDEGDWLPFRAFETFPTQPVTDPATKWIDLNGDGLPELVVSEETAFIWYVHLGRRGFGGPAFAHRPFDEERGPAVVFSDELQRIYVADMSGDGLSDIVRIRNGEICYWPNLGYGRFGAKVSMSHAPAFDSPDDFNPAYLQLVEISGTGATDLIYVGKSPLKAYINLAGNAWSDAQLIDPFPTTEPPVQLTVCDFTGNGTGSLVWSSPEPHQADAPLRYIDLMGGRKPYVMTAFQDNVGKTVSITYRSSTGFYLDDKAAGTPWRTRLPFPVQCVAQLVQHDAVTNLRLVQQYSYHHGYYDSAEREFRGFGRVDQRDTETFENWVRQDASNIVDAPLHEPVVLTRTWYHTGAFIDREHILTQFESEYWYNAIREVDPTVSVSEYQLSDAELPAGMTETEYREALRACKGMTLRQEVFALDAPDAATLVERVRQATPYSVTTHNACVQLIQPKQDNAHAVFILKELESIQFHYERQVSDPRIAHTLHTVIDKLGYVRESASVVYGRQATPADTAERVRTAQETRHVTYTCTDYTNDVRTTASYRLREVCATRTFELTGVVPAHPFFTPDELQHAFTNAADILYETTPSLTLPQRRNIEHSRTLFLADDVQQPLPLGQLSALGLSYENYQLAFSAGLLTAAYGNRVTAAMLEEEGHYVPSSRYQVGSPDPALAGLFPANDPPDDCWIPSGRALYPADPPAHFFQPDGYRDPAGTLTRVRYWGDYHLMLAETEDALGNQITIEEVDFRFLMPRQILDPNGNRSAVRYNRLGLVAGSAVLGKGDEADTFEGFRPDLSPTEVATFLADPETQAAALLMGATSRFVYDLDQFRLHQQPIVVGSISRETHHRESEQTGVASRLQLGFEYTGGWGQVVMKKVQAEPGEAKQLVTGPDGVIAVMDVDTAPQLRWVGNGRTVFNNKGKPVRTYQPYFSVTHRYENAHELVEVGVSSLLVYDAVGRHVRTDNPNQTLTRQEIGAWESRSFDANDTVLESNWYTLRADGGLGPQEQQAAQQTAVHAGTPVTVVLDSLGRSFLNREWNRFSDPQTGLPVEEIHETFVTFDIEGNQRSITDARGNEVMQYVYDRLGHPIFQRSMDAGDHWLLNDSMGKVHYTWDAEGRRFQTRYDVLHRPTTQVVRFTDGTEQTFDRLEYGTNAAPDVALNRNLKLVRHFDGAGVTENRQFDVNGNTLETTRQFVADYRQVPDWADHATVTLRDEVFRNQTTYNALSRPTSLILPDNSRIEPAYNESNLLTEVAATIGSAPRRRYVQNIDYDERGQRQRIDYGNDTFSTYQYDLLTRQLSRTRTIRTVDESGAAVNELLQDLTYTYDPIGNITALMDASQQTLFYNGAIVEPSQTFVYDALHRLLLATGREHAGGQQAASEFDGFRAGLVHKGDGLALQNYAQRYEYDAVGNMLRMIHRAGRGSLENRWTRSFTYAATNNHLLISTVGDTVSSYAYDVHGNMTSLPHLPTMHWDFENLLERLELGGGGTAFYQYDATGQRVRKVVERAGGLVQERLYLGAFEVYTEQQAGAVTLRRESVHVMDNTRRLALVETRVDVPSAPLIRYQYSNHLDTATLELDEQARIISYEEYYPFGSTSYQAGRSQAEVAQKRYRYTGKERDEESGFYYHGARYYAPWLARWTKADPIDVKGGINVYVYVANNPINANDPTGLWPDLRSVAIVTAAVVVGIGITALTAGAAAPVVAGFMAGALGSGAVATVATGIVVGAVAGAAGGAASGIAGEVVRGSIDRNLSAEGVARAGAEGLVAGAVGGAVAGGLGGAATALRAGAAATRVASTATAATRTARTAQLGGRVVQGAAQGAISGASGEGARQAVFDKSLDGRRVLGAGLVGGALGAGFSALNIGAGRPTTPGDQARYNAGFMRGLQVRGATLNAASRVTGNNYVIATHGTVSKRSVVTVATPSGNRAFYKRLGKGTDNTGGAQAGDWSPFEGFSKGGEVPVGVVKGQRIHLSDPEIIKPGLFVKDRINADLDFNNDFFKYGTPENRATSNWLKGQSIEPGANRNWQSVQPELEAVGVHTRDPVVEGVYYYAGKR